MLKREKKRVGKAVGLGTGRVCLGSRLKLALPPALSRAVGRESVEEEARGWRVCLIQRAPRSPVCLSGRVQAPGRKGKLGRRGRGKSQVGRLCP